MTLCCINKVTCVNTGDPLLVGVKHSHLIGFVLALGDLTFSIYMEPLAEHFQQIWPALGNFMIDRR